MAVFPDERLLELHFAECHDPIVDIRKDRGEKTFACFVPTCVRMFETPAKRRMHLIDAHHYPKEYFFAVVNKGIAGLLEKWGEGVSLVRPEWKPRVDQKEGMKGVAEEQGMEAGPSTPRGPLTPPHDIGLGLQFPEADKKPAGQAAALPNASEAAIGPSQPLGWTFGTNRPSSAQFTPRQARQAGQGASSNSAPSRGARPEISHGGRAKSAAAEDGDTSMDGLAEAMSSVSLVPRSIRFGRGGARAGFQRPSGRKGPASDTAPGVATLATNQES